MGIAKKAVDAKAELFKRLYGITPAAFDKMRSILTLQSAYADRDAAEILGSPGGEIYQREKRKRNSSAICREAKDI